MVVTEILPSDTYRISQLEPSNGRPYATIAHVSQLKAWRRWSEDDDDSSENPDDEPEMQRHKRTFVDSNLNVFHLGLALPPELFQKRIRECLKGLNGVVGLMDEFVVYGETEQEHDKRLYEVLQKLQDSGWTLDAEKCQFSKNSINFSGYVIFAGGISPDTTKTEAIKKMSQPTNRA
ncbi:hypothetical protein AVEN_16283-1 [Araneus ventricosus]|uniref:Reverse transcriptase domain-containing protein n=1 Tax=Araneus ventricosus TaxID=182803 RepID=A0A4Y2LSE3_ARAVE|nr:hypothetical protein AVEN_16283-1 [Araneus ventricosus]